jgi:hypothetical protein
MSSRDKVVDLEENSKDKAKLCCLENLTTTDLKVNTIINVPVLTVDIVEERDGK